MIRRIIGGTAILVLFGTVSLWAQQSIQSADLAGGLQPYQSYHGGNIDNVSLTSGNLMVKIPLISYPQRGSKLKLSYSLVWNGKPWTVITVCVPQVPCTYHWGINGGTSLGYGDAGGIPQSGSGMGVVDDQDVETVGYTFTWSIPPSKSTYSAFITAWRSSDGAVHPGVQISAPQVGQVSVDGSGFFNGYDQSNKCSANCYTFDANGIIYHPTDSILREDPNGNEITEDGGHDTVDTVGRIIPPVPAASTSGDKTGCTGPLPTYSTSIWQVPGANGSNLAFKFCYAQVSISLPAADRAIAYQTTSVNLQSIVLPNGQTWTFEYNGADAGDPSGLNYGDLTKITFPTGGTISYTYMKSPVYNDSAALDVQSRTVNANDGTGPHKWTYSGYYENGGAATQNMTVTNPDGTQVVHAFTSLPANSSIAAAAYETSTKYYQGTAGSSPVLRTVQTSYQDIEMSTAPIYPGVVNVLPISKTTILDNGLQSVESMQYCCAATVTRAGEQTGIPPGDTFTYGLISDDKTSAYNGSLLREDKTTYEWQNNSAYLNPNLLNLPAETQVLDGGGNVLSQTNYTYDESAYLTGSGIAKQHVSPMHTLRGNATTVVRYLNTGSSPTSHTNWYDTGEPYRQIDPMGHTTTFAYSPTYYGSLPTTITDPMGYTTTYSYDFNLGLKTSSEDPNNQTTTYAYDNLGRLKTVTYPDVYPGTSLHGETTYSYNDAVPTTVTISKVMNPTTTEQFELDLDGLGRLQHTKELTNPLGTVETDISYDGLGRKYSVSNPHLSTPSATDGTTLFTYDALNRKKTVTEPDGSSTILYTYTGRAEEVQDEGNGTTRVARVIQRDSLGHLTYVCEVTGQTQQGSNNTPSACGEDIAATGFLTSYGMDALGNVLSVQQAGLPTRSFVYDTLSRLTSAYNPESGTTTYTYDPDSKIQTRTRPAPNQGSASVTATTTYSYDADDRLTSETYSDQNASNAPTPSAYFDYDSASNAKIQDAGPNKGQNLVDRMVDAYVKNSGGTIVAGEAFSYDPAGRVWDNPQCTQSNCTGSLYNIDYTYDVAGDILTETDQPSDTLTYGYNGVQQIASITGSLNDAQHPPSLMSKATYTPLGGISAASFGNGTAEALSYNDRGWVLGDTVQGFTGGGSPTTLYSYAVNTYAPDGNMLKVTDSVNGTWAYTFDDFNRIATATVNPGQGDASELGWEYDRYGNRWTQKILSGTASWPQPQFSFTGGNNRVNQYGYDAAGNMTSDGVNCFTYDDEGRLLTVACGATQYYAYVYDAEGRRVHNVDATAGPQDFIYDLGERSVSAYLPAAGHYLRNEIYAGSLHVATYVNSTTYFDHTDWIGNERVRSGVAGTNIETCSNLPFGDGLNCSGYDPSPLHFTGAMRDTDVGLDYMHARYYYSTPGRWMLPDWSAVPVAVPYANLNNPQTLNLYTYVGNNPITHTDVDGHCAEAISCTIEFGAAGSAFGPAGIVVGAVAGAVVGGIIGYYGGKAVLHYLRRSNGAGKAQAKVKPASGEKKSTLAPGDHATDSIPARGPQRDFTPEERQKINSIGKCHTCGTTNPGTKSGNFVPDHQPPSATNAAGDQQRLYPQCIGCSRQQGGEVRAQQQQQQQQSPAPDPAPMKDPQPD